MVWPASPHGLPPLSYKRRGGAPLITHLGHCLFFLPPSCIVSPSSHGFRAGVALPKISFLRSTKPLCCSRSSEDLLLPLLCWDGGRRSSSSRTCARSRMRCWFAGLLHDLEIGK